MEKKGIMRVVEAIIAIMIVFSAIILIYSQRTSPEREDVSEEIWKITDQAARDYELRNRILAEGENSEEEVREFIEGKINPSLNFEVEVCEMEEECAPEEEIQEKEIFSVERIITVGLQEEDFEPKKVRLFVWRKSY